MANQSKSPKVTENVLPEYPEQTHGSQVATETRREANRLTEEQREELFRSGMRIIYGETPVAERARAR